MGLCSWRAAWRSSFSGIGFPPGRAGGGPEWSALLALLQLRLQLPDPGLGGVGASPFLGEGGNVLPSLSDWQSFSVPSQASHNLKKKSPQLRN